ncbi:MAG: type I DNA topoisomerase [Clostridiales bacterium]|nr:type I DNA topoisomerase [Clostridiales bacterium]
MVESPAKAKTIEKFLGKNYKVIASIGHIRDLPKSKMGIDIENDFEPKYINIRGKGTIIKEIKKLAKKSDKILLTTDPDREGEAIAWHLAFLLGLDENEESRIAFNEITKEAVRSAVKKPRKLDKDLIDAQQARRVLDRLVGYSISPILWRKVKKGLSAGRVQSVATKIICDRENEIKSFVSEEYWNIDTDLATVENKNFNAKLVKYKGKEIKIENALKANEIENELLKNQFSVKAIDKKIKSRNPNYSFTTSSMQQEASNRYNFSTKKTMIIAQQLYEGVKLSKGLVGLITYMRTDSTRISNEAREQAKEYITQTYGNEFVSTKNNVKNKKNAQDAHEAIRPSSVLRTPNDLKGNLTKDQFKLYELIWQRFLASQMAPAKFNSLSVQIKNGEYLLKANGSQLVFEGFLKIAKNIQKDKILPKLVEGEILECQKLNKEQKFTQPPARYSEASLVKEMEEKGIGRPSTYAPTISTILSRGYVERQKKTLFPTELGFIINDIMTKYFMSIVDVDFTAAMEGYFDLIEKGEEQWKNIIKNFYVPFENMLEVAENDLEKIDLTEPTDIDCDLCGAKMVIKHGRYGKFLACSNYPECKNTKPILKEIGVKCPKCEKGQIVERRTKKYKIFYGCSEFPNCNFVSWNKPINKKCPECGSILVEGKSRDKEYYVCSNKECAYKEKRSVNKDEHIIEQNQKT